MSDRCAGDTDRSSYPWNVHVSLGGVSFYGPGMGSEMEAEAIAQIVENGVGADVEVIRQ